MQYVTHLIAHLIGYCLFSFWDLPVARVLSKTQAFDFSGCAQLQVLVRNHQIFLFSLCRNCRVVEFLDLELSRPLAELIEVISRLHLKPCRGGGPAKGLVET